MAQSSCSAFVGINQSPPCPLGYAHVVAHLAFFSICCFCGAAVVCHIDKLGTWTKNDAAFLDAWFGRIHGIVEKIMLRGRRLTEPITRSLGGHLEVMFMTR